MEALSQNIEFWAFLNVELWAFLIIAIPLVIQWTFQLSSHLLAKRRINTIFNLKNKNKALFQTGEQLMLEIKEFPTKRNEIIEIFIRYSLILQVYMSPFHLTEIIGKLEWLRYLGLSSSEIHSIMVEQMVNADNQMISEKHLILGERSEQILVRRLIVDSLMIPPLEFPNTQLNDSRAELRNYVELRNRFKQISELKFSLSEIRSFSKFLKYEKKVY